MRLALTLSLLSACCLPALARAEPGPIVAVFDLDDRSQALDDRTRADLADYLAVLLTEGGWQVVPRDQLRARILEQKSEGFRECYDQGCQVELGRELAAQKTLATQIFKVGARCRVTGTLYDLKRAATEKAVREEAACQVDELGLALERIAANITRKLDSTSLEKARKEQEEAAREKAKAEEAAREKTRADEAAREKARADEAAREKARAEEAAREKARAEEAAREKARAEEAAREKARAEEAARAEAPAAGARFEPTAVLGLSLGLLSPELGEGTQAHLWSDGRGEARFFHDPGLFLELTCDFPVVRYFSIGLSLGFLHADLRQANEPQGENEGSLDLLWPSLKLKGRLPLGDAFELRLALGVGAAVLLNFPTAYIPGVDPIGISEGVIGVSTHVQLEFVWWFLERLGLSAALGVFTVPWGEFSLSDVEFGFGLGPLITFTLGLEFGL
jgi:hypothetical protein